MPERSLFDYAIIRVVPCLERGEFLNTGVILFSRTREFLDARIALDVPRLRALSPGCDMALVASHLTSIERICAGGPDGGPIGRLSRSERFHWLVAPRSTILQLSPVHPGLCVDPAAELERLFTRLVLREGEPHVPKHQETL